MAINWSHLPKELWSQLCMCGAKNGFTQDPETKWWLCADCKNPSILAAVKECELCEKVFIPAKFTDDKYGIMCDDCSSSITFTF